MKMELKACAIPSLTQLNGEILYQDHVLSMMIQKHV